MEPNQPQPGDGPSGGGSVATNTKERAADIATEAGGAVSGIAHEAMDEVRNVAQTASSEVSDVVDEVRRVVHGEADKQTHTLSDSMRRVADDLRAMAQATSDETMAADYVGRIGRSLSTVADRLDDGGIDGALGEMRQVARRHPGLFLTGAAMSGFTMARVLRHAGAPSHGTTDESLPRGAHSLPSDQVDLRDPIQASDGHAPRLPNDVQEWARP